jgi:flavin reductase (DIM6/NTAB) family NADH-FMN oxidoreductase RutF
MTHRQIDPTQLEGREPYFLITALVVPRPIAWVSTVSEDGINNVAPHSYFNVISSNPWILHFTSTGEKDTLRNVKVSGDFVINVVGREVVEKMNYTSGNLPPDESEFEWAGLTPVPSVRVGSPRVGEARASFECKLDDIVSKGNGHMVFGKVVLAHVDDDLFVDGRIDPRILRPVGRLAGSQYTDAAEGLFEIKRPTWDEIRTGSYPPPDP